jgi:predicted O-methyltransferase YrrM
MAGSQLTNIWRDTVRDVHDLTPVGLLQRQWEITQLLTLYRLRQPRRVLEVGTYHGGTLKLWADAAWTPQLVSIDTFTAADPRADFPGVTFLQGNSADPAIIVRAAEFGPFDFIFLDAGHARHEVQRDWENYLPLAVPSGIIALHDILPGRGAQAWIDVAPVWQQIRRQGFVTQELVASEDVNWGGIGIVYL